MERQEMARQQAEQARIMALTAAIADPDGDGKIAGDDDGNELTGSKRPSEAITLVAGGAITVGGSDELGKNDHRCSLMPRNFRKPASLALA